MPDLTTTQSPSPLAALLSDPERVAALDVDKMRALLEMRREEEREDARRQFMSAFAAVQAELAPILRDAVNEQTRSRYAKLATVHEKLRPVYTRHGFSLMHGEEPGAAEGSIRIGVDVMHAAGHMVHKYADVPIDAAGIKGNVNKTPTHAKGSTLTYGIRYVDTLVFAPEYVDEDTDAARAVETVSLDQALNLSALADEQPDLGSKLLAWAKVDAWEGVAAHRYAAIVQRFEKGRAG